MKSGITASAVTATTGLSLPFFTGSAEASHNPRVEVWTGDDVNALWTTSPKLTGDAEVRWNPVTIAGPLSNVEDNPAHVRLRNVSEDGFDIKAEEWDDTGYGHYPEKTHAIHMEEDTDETGSGHIVSAKTVTASDDDWSYWTPPNEVSIRDSILLATIQTHNGGQSVVPRLDSYVSYDGSGFYRVKMQEKEAYDNGHVQETIGLLSIEKGHGTLEGRKFEAGTWTWPDGALGWQTIEFDRSYPGTTPPMFLADIQTFNGGDTCNLRYRNLTHDSVEITLEEETSADPEIGHTNEEIGYLVMESPYISPEEKYQVGSKDEVSEMASKLINSYTLLSSEVSTLGGFDTGSEWMFEFNVQGHGVHRHYDLGDSPDQGWKADGINEHYIQVSDSSSVGDFSYSTAEGRIGGYPAPKFTSLELAENVVESLALSSIGRASKYVGGLIAASDVYNTLKSGYSKNVSDITGDNRRFRWEYSDWDSLGDKHSDVMHHLQFWYILPYGESSTFNVKQDVQGQAESGGLTATTIHNIEVGSPDSDTLNMTSGSDTRLLSKEPETPVSPQPPEVPDTPVPAGAESLSKAEKKQYGIKQVRQRQLESSGIVLPERVTTGGEMIPWMVNPPIKLKQKTMDYKKSYGTQNE